MIGVAKSPPESPKNRFLTVGGHPAFETSFWCGMCALLFQRSTSFETYLPPDVLRDRLSASLDHLDPEILTAFPRATGWRSSPRTTGRTRVSAGRRAEAADSGHGGLPGSTRSSGRSSGAGIVIATPASRSA